MRVTASIARYLFAGALLAASAPAPAQPRAKPPSEPRSPGPVPVKHSCSIESERISFQLSYVLRGLDRDGRPVRTRELVGVRCRQSLQWVTGIDSGGVSSKVDRWDCDGAQMGLRDLDQDHAIGTFGGVAPMTDVSIATPAELDREWASTLEILADPGRDTWESGTRQRAIATLRDFRARLARFGSGGAAARAESALVRWGDSVYFINSRTNRVQVVTANLRVLASAEARCDGIATD